MAKNRPRRGSPLHLTSAFGLFNPSKDLILKHIWIFGPLYGVFIFFSLHSWMWTPSNPSGDNQWWDNFFVTTPAGPSLTFFGYSVVGFSLLWLLITAVIGTIAQIMIQAAQLEAAQGRTPAFEKLWASVKELGFRMFGLYIVVSLVILVGLILLIIPGLFMIKRYFLSPYVMLDKKVGIREAMDKSAAISKPFSAIWGIVLVMILYSLIAIIPLIGWLVSFILLMLYSAAPALRYQELKKLT